MEVGNLPEKEFRVKIVKTIRKLKRRMDAQSKKLVFNRVGKHKKQPKRINAITEIKTRRNQ